MRHPLLRGAGRPAYSKALEAKLQAAESRLMEARDQVRMQLDVVAKLGSRALPAFTTEQQPRRGCMGQGRKTHGRVHTYRGIFVILAIQFSRVSYPLLVMLAIPFGAIGIIVGFFLHGQQLSIMAMMGFVALTGVVVNDSLVIAVFIQRSIETGMTWREAVHEAGKRRLRAVLLTTITTVVGLLTTAYGCGGFDPFVSPMASALSWGLIFSTDITLLSISAAFDIGMDVKYTAGRIW